MAWYYYTGNVVRSIPVLKGRSVAVRPHTKFEVFDESLSEVQQLAARGVIRRTAKDPGARSSKKDPVAAVDPKSVSLPVFSQSVAEKGVTLSRDATPVSSVSELTIDEARSAVDLPDDNKKSKSKGSK